jgi:hypothetical protein
MQVLVLVRFRETVRFTPSVFGFLERERERTHSLAHSGTSLTASLLARRKSPKANTKQEQPKRVWAQSTGKEPKTQNPRNSFRPTTTNKVD